MPEEILKYLKTQNVAVLALEMLDGSPHASTVHFAHAENPLVFFFETNRDYRKSEPLFGKATTRASLVVGSDEAAMKTLQFDGIAELIKLEEKSLYDSVYFEKFPKKKEKANDPKCVFFKFTPTWWRFTDWTAPKGKMILTSQ
ncbi:MAG: pyridoxamine 5'-phosphate oxidase family protein [Patescibacteria group bacterium]